MWDAGSPEAPCGMVQILEVESAEPEANKLLWGFQAQMKTSDACPLNTVTSSVGISTGSFDAADPSRSSQSVNAVATVGAVAAVGSRADGTGWQGRVVGQKERQQHRKDRRAGDTSGRAVRWTMDVEQSKTVYRLKRWQMSKEQVDGRRPGRITLNRMKWKVVAPAESR